MSEVENTLTTRRVRGPWATLGFGVVVMAVFFSVQALVAVVFAVVSAIARGFSSMADFLYQLSVYEGLLQSVATIASSIVCTGLILVIVKVRRSISITEYLALKPIKVKVLIAAIAIMAGFIILSDGLNIVIERPLYPDSTVRIYETSVWPALLWISFVVFGPIFEELLFRGFLFEGFRRSPVGPIGAIAITSLAWTSLHVQYGLYELATILVLGIVLGIVRLKTGSIWSTLIMHAFANMVATLEVAINLRGLLS